MDSLIKAYQSFLKIPHASIRFASGKMDTWKWANLWSSDYFNYPRELMIMNDFANMKNFRATAGQSVRCIKN